MTWDRFYRGKHSEDAPESGTGLGLALVKELTEAMGVTVEVDSVVGKGSCFTLKLPAGGAWSARGISPSSNRLLADGRGFEYNRLDRHK